MGPPKKKREGRGNFLEISANLPNGTLTAFSKAEKCHVSLMKIVPTLTPRLI